MACFRWEQGLICWLLIGLCLMGCSTDPDHPCRHIEPGEERSCAKLYGLRMDTTLPPSPGNPWADNEEAANIGYQLFFDSRLSQEGLFRCATCHGPELHFTDGKQIGVGLLALKRNTISLLSTAASPWYFWDGRSTALWLAPLVALEAHDEMNLDAANLPSFLQTNYLSALQGIGAPLPKQGLEALGLVGQLLEAYMRRIVGGPSPFDAFMDGEAQAIDTQAQQGLRIFMERGCAECHSGPWLTDWQFRKLVPTDSPFDLGRAVGRTMAQQEIVMLQQSNLGLSPQRREAFWAQPKIQQLMASAPQSQDEGAFRTPSLRDVINTGPYGHDGRWFTVGQAIQAHWTYQASLQLGPSLSPSESEALVAFLTTLQSSPRFKTDTPPDYWSWPYR